MDRWSEVGAGPGIIESNNRKEITMKSEEALALVGGHVDEELLVRNEYLATENEILKSKIISNSNNFDFKTYTANIS